jgi:hypothetical protein
VGGDLGAPDREAKSQIHDAVDHLYSQRYTALQGERITTVKAAARRTYETLRYSEAWHAEDRPDPKQEAADNRTILQFASSFFPTVYMLVVTKCFSVYEERLEQDTDEARAERERYERLRDSVDVDAYAAESVRRTAERFYERWLQHAGLDQAKHVASEVINLVDDYVVAAAFSSLVDEVPIEASREEWNEAFKQRIPEQSDQAFRFFYVTFVDQKADDLVRHLNPAGMPLEELRAWAGITWLERRVPEDDGDLLSYGLPDTGWLGRTVPAPSAQPFQSVDRAARQLGSWDFSGNDGPVFLDPNSGNRVTYNAEGLSLELARRAVRRMSARTADVWRLTTVLILEQWQEWESEPPSVEVDVRRLCDAMGFKKHSHGGHKSENIAVVVAALRDLGRMRIEIALGSEAYPEDPATGRRAATRVNTRRISKVLMVTGVEEVNTLVDDEHPSLRWKVTAGEWTKNYPRTEFAPLYRSLIELPGRNTTDLWAKALGTELIWQYWQDEGNVQIQSVQKMLKQAGVLEKALADKYKQRVRDNFEKAMELLEEHGVCDIWNYNAEDDSKVIPGARSWFEVWLEARVEVIPPPVIERAMKEVAQAERKQQKRARARIDNKSKRKMSP